MHVQWNCDFMLSRKGYYAQAWITGGVFGRGKHTWNGNFQILRWNINWIYNSVEQKDIGGKYSLNNEYDYL